MRNSTCETIANYIAVYSNMYFGGNNVDCAITALSDEARKFCQQASQLYGKGNVTAAFEALELARLTDRHNPFYDFVYCCFVMYQRLQCHRLHEGTSFIECIGWHDRSEESDFINTIDEMTHKYPNNHNFYNLRGEATYHNHVESAIADFSHAIFLSKGQIQRYCYNRGTALIETGQYQLACDDLIVALSLIPGVKVKMLS